MKIKSLLKKIPWSYVLFFLFLLFVFLLNTFHEEYPDEYDSILGGKYIVQGRLQYRDWFQHHQPFAYTFAAFLLPVSGISFVRFRILLAIAFFVLNTGAYFLLKKRFKNKNLTFYLFFLFITAVSATYFWGQMLLADTLSAYLIIPAYALLLLKDFYNKKFGEKDLLIFSLFAFFAWLTSLTCTYLLAGLYLYAFYLYAKNVQKRELKRFALLHLYF